MEKNNLLDSLRRHWFKGVLLILLLASAGSWGERFFKKKKQNNTRDFQTAERLVSHLHTGEPLSIESISLIETILKRHPELHPQYDSLLACSMVQQRNTAKAAAYSSSITERTSFADLPHYREFTEISLLILENQTQEAITRALKLEDLLQETTEFSLLRGFNLLRLLFLTQNQQEAREFWEKLQKIPQCRDIESLFTAGEYTLREFVNARLIL